MLDRQNKYWQPFLPIFIVEVLLCWLLIFINLISKQRKDHRLTVFLKHKKDMSYDIHLFRKETKEREQKLNDESFFDDEKNLEPFTAPQIEELKARLAKYNYVLHEKSKYGFHFEHPEYGQALLTDEALYFSTDFNEENIFEVGMTASEFTDTGEYQKYDPQNGEWEEY